jgi:hypothetical protein
MDFINSQALLRTIVIISDGETGRIFENYFSYYFKRNIRGEQDIHFYSNLRQYKNYIAGIERSNTPGSINGFKKSGEYLKFKKIVSKFQKNYSTYGSLYV